MRGENMEGTIYKAINGVMSDIGAVGKDSYNEMQKFKFRGIDAVMNALYPALVKNKVFVVPEVLEQTREERQSSRGGNLIYSICKIRFTFYAEDGSFVQAVTVGEGMDSGDKATNKAMAIALKYAFFQVFCVPTEEMSDPDAESPETAPKTAKTAIITEAEKKTVEALCKQCGYDPAKAIKGWPNITGEQYTQTVNYLRSVIESKKSQAQ
jgi:hypothetical protein